MTTIQIDENCFLKSLELSDAKELFALIEKNREHLKKWLPWLEFTKTVSDSESFINTTIEEFKENKRLQLGIWFNNQIAGVIGHHEINWANKTTSIGYWLGESFAGNGLMTKSCQSLVDYSFSELKLNRVEIACATGNDKSQAIPKRLGFTLEGTLRQKEWLYDHFVDHMIFGICADSWPVDERS